ncbi:MAG: FkbM family methyltransferase [Pseudanabaenaceae cyanobacterium]
MFLSSHLGAAHRFLSRQPVVVTLALKLRNQCNRIIQCSLEDTTNSAINGEEKWIRAIAPHCQTFVDVGANVGNWSATFVQAMVTPVRGLLFEPSAAAHRILQQRFADDPGVEIVAAALSDTVGTALFYEEPEAGETSSLVAQHSQKQAQGRWVPVTTLDRAIAERGWERVDFVKIDAEGYDFRVLQGAQQLLQPQKIGSLQFEYNAPWALVGSTLAAALNLLQGFGYQTFLLKSTGLHRFDYTKYGEFFGYANFVAVSPALQSVVEPARTTPSPPAPLPRWKRRA